MTAAKASTRASNGAQADAGHAGLLEALLAVQRDAPTLPKDATNPHFKSKYTPLDTLVEHVGPILTRHGLVWTTLPCRDEQGGPAMRYRLAHVASGETLEDVMPLMLGKADSQGMGAAITYARRYSLAAVLNLVADDDDDGERTRRPAPDAEPRLLPPDKVEALRKLVEDAGLTAYLPAKLREAGVKAVEELTVEQAISVYTWVTESKGGE